MSFWDWVYRYFEKPGKSLLSIYNNLPRDIRRSGIHLYPETYASFVVFATIIITIISIVLAIIFFFIGIYLAVPVMVAIPFFSFILLIYLPALIGGSRAGGLEGEFPYTTSYLSMMVMSGLSPYVAFERIIRASKIFTKSSELAQRFILMVKVLGRDPLTAFSMLSDRTPSATVRDLLMGYITTVRAGGDVVDYLTKKARLMFSEILVKMKITADRLGGLLEAYLALVLLSMISLTIIYFITTSFVSYVPFGMSPAVLFLILYVAIPMISGMVIYLADLIQYKEPWIDYRPYIMFGGVTIPLILYFTIGSILLYHVLPQGHPLRETFLVAGFYEAFTYPARIANLHDYLYPAVAFSIVLIISTIPSAIYTAFVSREYKIVQGITRFLRDLVEIRKTGISPERGIIELSNRNYGIFTKYLKKMALQLSLGFPLNKIVDELFRKIIVWRAKVLLFVMTDTIEVGGGTIETMENLAWFAESVESIDDERKKNLRTLLIVPYMGAILSSFTVIMLAAYIGSLPMAVGGYELAATLTLPSVIMNTYLMGLVAGKVSAGSIAAGFKHAIILTFFALLILLASPLMGGLLTSLTAPPG
ncbi:MAG: secretion system protein [Desulfurococcales archaeon ex4484_58]|nr:MAG: secretion system protein [Desulfurococcales archaeon ex4484_58]